MGRGGDSARDSELLSERPEMLPRKLPESADRDRIAAARLAGRRLWERLAKLNPDWTHVQQQGGQVASRRRPGRP